MAHNLLRKICAELIEFMKRIITSPEFLARNRHSDKDFTRQRKLPFPVLIVFLINFVRGSYQKVAPAKARMKLRFQAFVELNQHPSGHFEEHFNPFTRHGFRLLAIDGSTMCLPHIKTVADPFSGCPFLCPDIMHQMQDCEKNLPQ